MAAQVSLAFLQGGPPPPFALPPPDADLQKRIDTLVAYAGRNGLSFVHMMAQRQGGNPEFSFLHGGPGHEYYAWALYCGLNGLPVTKPPQQQPAAAAAPAASPAAAAAPSAAPPSAQGQAAAQGSAAVLQTLPQEVSSAWGQVLGMLTGSRDSIRNSQQWFMACAPYAAGMAEMMLQHQLSLPDYQKQLHLIYLANDILFKAQGMRPQGSGPDADAIAQAFRPRLGRMLRHAYVSGGQSADVQQNLTRVVNFWAERGVYERLVVEQLTMELMGLQVPAAGGASQVGAGAAAAPGAAAAAAASPAQPAAQQPAQPQPQANGGGTAAATGGTGGGSWDIAAAARAAAAAINQKLGGGNGAGTQQPAGGAAAVPSPGSAPAMLSPQQQQAMQQQQQWGAAAAAAGQQQPWGQQPHGPMPAAMAVQYPGQLQYLAQPQYAMQYPGGTILPGPPPPESYYAPGSMPASTQQQQQPPQYGQQPAYGAAAAYPPPPHQQGAPHQQHGQPGQYPGQPPAGFFPQPGAPPGAYPQHSGAGPEGAFQQPPAPEPPQEEPFDPCCFPPGLIPRLVEEKLKTDPPYSPLSPLDIEEAGVPPPPQVDSYLRARVDKFYAQMADYRPGMLYSDIEVDAPRSRHFSDRGRPGAGPPGGGPPLPPPGAELPRAGLGLAGNPTAAFFMEAAAAQPVDDGTFNGPGVGGGPGGAGLGFGAARQEMREQRQREREARDREAQEAFAAGIGGAPGPGVLAGAAPGPGLGGPEEGNGDGGLGSTEGGVDVFSSYRHLRSKGYHQMIVNNAAKRWNPKGT